ncbi:MAG TPA: MOSC domain-containing protein [Actinomycetes bacterium]|nr:MOSC domain-containing protein [Actinomycetes bacterium]
MTASPRTGHLFSVNLAVVRDNPFKPAGRTGIDKHPTDDPVEVRSPGSKAHGLGSGLVGDFIGDRRSHGGDDQAVYAYALEDLQWWADELGETLRAGQFGENLTTQGLDVNDARIGERWRIGEDVELQVTDPRIPCGTFRGWMNRAGWLKTFTSAARPGTYLRVLTPGTIRGGDRLEVTHRPAHDVTVAMVFRALTTERELLPKILDAPELPEETREIAEQERTFELD